MLHGATVIKIALFPPVQCSHRKKPKSWSWLQWAHPVLHVCFASCSFIHSHFCATNAQPGKVFPGLTNLTTPAQYHPEIFKSQFVFSMKQIPCAPQSTRALHSKVLYLELKLPYISPSIHHLHALCKGSTSPCSTDMRCSQCSTNNRSK